MAVSFVAPAYESHSGTAGSTNEASFDIASVGFTSTTRGILVYTFVNANADDALSVKIDPAGANIDVPAVSGGRAVDTATEPGDCKAWFLGAGLPTSSATVRINRTNNANEMYAAALLVTAGFDTAVHTAGIVLQQTDGTLAEVNVDDGSPGTNSQRMVGLNSGLAAVPAAGTNSTVRASIDFGTRVVATATENTSGQGSRPVGFSSGTSDDRAGVYLAIKELKGVSADPGSYTVTGSAAELLFGAFLNAASGSYTITGFDATLTQAAGGITLNAEPGAYTVTGAAAELLHGYALNAEPGAYVVTGSSATLLLAAMMNAAPGAYALTGADAVLILNEPAGGGVIWMHPLSWGSISNVVS